jgi:hypothetical protein
VQLNIAPSWVDKTGSAASRLAVLSAAFDTLGGMQSKASTRWVQEGIPIGRFENLQRRMGYKSAWQAVRTGLIVSPIVEFAPW